MAKYNVEYLKDRDGNIITPVVCPDTIYDKYGHSYRDTDWQYVIPLSTDTDCGVISTYINASQSAYTRNCWRIFNGVLYLQIGVGCSSNSTLDTTTETEFARIPIGGAWSTGSANRIWSPTIGTGGEIGPCIYMRAYSSYIGVGIKPHSSSYLTSAYWGSTHFAIPLNDYTFDEEQLAFNLALTVIANGASSTWAWDDIDMSSVTVTDIDTYLTDNADMTLYFADSDGNIITTYIIASVSGLEMTLYDASLFTHYVTWNKTLSSSVGGAAFVNINTFYVQKITNNYAISLY